MKKAIVTGATGFIGKFLIRELISQNIEVISIVRENSKNIENIRNLPIQIIECDIDRFNTIPDIITDRNIDTVFHTAWQGVSDDDAKNQFVQLQNLRSTLDLIDAAYKMKIKTFIGCGSIHEAEALIEMAENKPIFNLGYMYKTSKIAAHWMGKAKAGSYGIRFFWPLINTYGEEETSPRLINTIIRKIYNNESPELSAGNQYYDFVHIVDVAHALFLIAEKGIDGTNYTIGSGTARPLKEYLIIAGEIANQFNGKTNIPLGFGKIVNDVVSLPKETFDITRLSKDTGFTPTISFEEGINRTARWIKYNLL